MTKTRDADDYIGQLGDVYYGKGMMREAFEQFISEDGIRGTPDAIAALRLRAARHDRLPACSHRAAEHQPRFNDLLRRVGLPPV